jgi:hypothetical protein
MAAKHKEDEQGTTKAWVNGIRLSVQSDIGEDFENAQTELQVLQFCCRTTAKQGN